MTGLKDKIVDLGVVGILVEVGVDGTCIRRSGFAWEAGGKDGKEEGNAGVEGATGTFAKIGVIV